MSFRGASRASSMRAAKYCWNSRMRFVASTASSPRASPESWAVKPSVQRLSRGRSVRGTPS
jgi:hypothetical protein